MRSVRATATSRAARVLATVAIALLVAPGVLYAFPALAGSDHAYVVLSGSMVPFFAPGDIIFVSEVTPDSLAPGDVVTFRAKPGSSTLITHRVIEVLRDGDAVRYRTQGDANEDPDPFVVKEEMVVGTYDLHIPWWGLLASALRTKAGYLFAILLPSALLLASQLVVLYRELDKWDRARQEARP